MLNAGLTDIDGSATSPPLVGREKAHSILLNLLPPTSHPTL